MSDWQKLLEPFGALWRGDELTGFAEDHSNVPLPEAVPMLDYRVLRATGPDVHKFLQGQLTCDLKRLLQQEFILGAHCNAKGRMVSSMTVFALDSESIGLRLRADLAETALGALSKYAVFSKLQILLSPLAGIAVLGSLSLEGLGDSELAPQIGHSASIGPYIVLQHPDWKEIWAPQPACEAFLASNTLRLAPPMRLRSFLVNRGIAEVSAKTSEEFIPQMLNFDLLDGLSFKKGCYTGQEIIARLHYRGQSKKRTYLYQGEGAEAGDKIVLADPPGAVVGEVVNASKSALLACLSTDIGPTSNNLRLEDKNRSILVPANQPYAIP